MFGTKRRQRRKLIDRASRGLFDAMNVGENQIAETAASVEFHRVRDLIAAGQRRATAPSGWTIQRSIEWGLAAASIVLIAVLGLILSRTPSNNTESIADSSRQTPPPSIAQVAPPAIPIADGPQSAITKPRIRGSFRRRTQVKEVVTDFFPLTYSADSGSVEGGHLVRVRMPRSALISLGIPANFERAGEPVKADVYFGDDGLARAIRFIQ